jgi:hypothetical protein
MTTPEKVSPASSITTTPCPDKASVVIVAICAGWGMWGIVSGYLAFFLLPDRLGQPLHLLTALLLAGILSWLIEVSRALIEGRTHDKPELPSRGRVLMTIVGLASAEFYVMALDRGYEVFTHGTEWKYLMLPVIAAIVGRVSEPSMLNLCLFAGLWAVLGAVLAGSLSLVIVARSEGSLTPRQQTIRSAGWGALTGLLAAPLAILAYVLVVRLCSAICLLLFDQRKWMDNLLVLQSNVENSSWSRIEGHLWFLPRALDASLGFIRWLDDLLSIFGWFGPPGALVIAICIILVLNRSEHFQFFGSVLGVAVALIVMAPLLGHLVDLLSLLVLAGTVWGLQGAFLGIVVPLLKPSSKALGLWGLLAFGSAAILIAVALIRQDTWYLLLPAGLLLWSGWESIRTGSINDLWPIMLVATGIIACGLTAGLNMVQDMAFAGVARRLQSLDRLPSDLRQEQKERDLERTARKFDLPKLSSEDEQPVQECEVLAKQLGLVNSPTELRHPKSYSIQYLNLDLKKKEPPSPERMKRIDSLRQDLLKLVNDAGANQAKRDELDNLKTGLARLDDNSGNSMENVVNQAADGKFDPTAAGVDPKRFFLVYAWVLNAQKEFKEFLLKSTRERELVALFRDKYEESTSGWQDPAVPDLVSRANLVISKMDKDSTSFEESASALCKKEKANQKKGKFWLELALTGSLGYWTTLGLLVGWVLHGQATKGTKEEA